MLQIRQIRFHAKYWLQLIWLIITQFQRWEFSTGKATVGFKLLIRLKPIAAARCNYISIQSLSKHSCIGFGLVINALMYASLALQHFKIVKSPWTAAEDKFCQKKGARMSIALHSSVYQTDDIDDDVGWLSSYEPVWARGWSIYRAEAHCGPPASSAQLNSVCFDFPGCWTSVLSILITITHKDGGVVYLQITLFIDIYSLLLTLDLGQP